MIEMREEKMTNREGKTLTIFGCGYVGSALARQAINDGMCVAALTRNHNTANGLRELGVNPVIEAELDSTTWHDKLNPRQDFVLNCVSSGDGGLAAYHKSYYLGQSSILSWVNEGSVGTLVFTSSTSVYPQSNGKWIDEVFTHEGASKEGKVLLDAEHLLTTNVKGIQRYFILRLAGIYGPGRHHLLDQLRKGCIQVEEYVDRRLNIIHRDDICSAIYACLFAPDEMKNQILNVTDDNPARKKHLLHWLGEKIGKSPYPCQLMKAKQNQWRETRRRRALPDRMISNKKIKLMLGWSPAYPSYKDGYQAILS